MKKYYVYDGINEIGPFEYEELRLQKINETTPIWFEELIDWTPAGEIQELSTLFIRRPPKFEKTKILPELKNEPDIPFSNNSKYQYSKKIWTLGIVLATAVIGFLLFKIDAKNNEISNTQNQLKDQINKEAKTEADKQAIINVSTKKNMEYRNNWQKYISIEIDSYKVLALGGIEKITLKASNNTEFPIDIIIADLYYWKDNGEIYKVEQVSFTDIANNDISYINAASSPRGTKLSIEIKKITARKFNFCFDLNDMTDRDRIINNKKNPADPWKCDQ